MADLLEIKQNSNECNKNSFSSYKYHGRSICIKLRRKYSKTLSDEIKFVGEEVGNKSEVIKTSLENTKNFLKNNFLKSKSLL